MPFGEPGGFQVQAALHPTLTRVWSRKGRRGQRLVEAPGKNAKVTGFGALDWRDGFFHGLGHGVGLEVHEEPALGRGPGELVAGDVIAVEPGLYRNGYGGCRLEDLVHVTEDGAEILTDYPYDLAP